MAREHANALPFPQTSGSGTSWANSHLGRRKRLVLMKVRRLTRNKVTSASLRQITPRRTLVVLHLLSIVIRLGSFRQLPGVLKLKLEIFL